jgi:hypothetical protein
MTTMTTMTGNIYHADALSLLYPVTNTTFAINTQSRIHTDMY